MSGRPDTSNRRGTEIVSRLRRLPWFSRRRQAGLTAQLMTLAFVWALSIFALATGCLWWTAEQVIRDNMRQQAYHWLAKFDDLGTTLLVSNDPALFEPISRHIANFPEVVFLRFVAPDGAREVARFVSPAVDPSLLTPFTARDLKKLVPGGDDDRPVIEQEISSAGILRVSMPALIKSISRDGLIAFSFDEEQAERLKIIGYVDVGLDFHSYRRNLGRHILFGSLLILALSLTASVVGRAMIKRALRPLSDLQIPLDRLARGETDIEVQSTGAAEIVAIGNALNTTIAALKERDRELHRLATFDALTGLINRHSFNRELEREKARVLLDESTSALLFIDLDRFKEVNDTVGHTGGDELLSQVAHLLSSKVRSNDVVSRLGGDEFTIILRNTSEAQAIAIAGQIGAAMRDFSFSAGGQTFKLNCSIGITTIDASRTTTAEMLSQADTACHEAKNHGRDCFKLYREVAPEEVLDFEGSGLREQIERALGEGGFSLCFSPVKECAGSRVLAFETLVQMNGREKEIPARAFFMAAERLDLAPRIDRWVIDNALRQLSAAGNTLSLSINLSGRTLQQDGIIDYIGERLAGHRVSPERVSFEIPERTVLDSVTQTKNFIEKVRGLGCGVILDDFGISLNSINVLKHLPVNQLKIEAGLIGSAGTSPFSQAVIASIVQIARELGIETVAKGVRRDDEAAALRNLGVHYLQEHDRGRPLRRLPACAA